MDKYQKNNICVTNNKSCQVKSRPSLFETLNAVKVQIGYQDFAQKRPNGKMIIDPLIEEICLVIAEVLVRPPRSIMRIRGCEIEAAIVQEVYGKLTFDHVDLVFNNFRQQTHVIKKKSAYMQTALYNAVFELNAHYTNLVANDSGGVGRH